MPGGWLHYHPVFCGDRSEPLVLVHPRKAMASAAPVDGVLQLDACAGELVHESFTCDTRDHEDHTCALGHALCPPPASALAPLRVAARRATWRASSAQVLRHDVRRAGRDGAAHGVRGGELRLAACPRRPQRPAGPPGFSNGERAHLVTPERALGRPGAPGGGLRRPSQGALKERHERTPW
eukprot:scaffold94193_cov63-Phaeocystis_antarctica.AAC.7